MGDLRRLPGYVDNVDPVAQKLESVLEKYSTSEEMYCGLVCGQRHFNGFLVKLEDGRLTNLGKDCGRKHFGENFTILKNQFIKQREIEAQVLRIETLRCRVGTILSEVNHLANDPRGAKWIQKAKEELRTSLPLEVWAKLCDMARQGRVEVFAQRERTAEQLDAIRALRADIAEKDVEKLRFYEERIGELTGTKVIQLDLRALIADQLKLPLQRLAAVGDIDVLENSIRRDFVELADSVDIRLMAAREAIQCAQEFFREINLQLIRSLAVSEQAKRSVKRLKWDRRNGWFTHK
jgi:hypothetical protein